MRSLACTTDCDIAYADGRHISLMYLLYPFVVEEMSDLETQPIWKKQYLVHCGANIRILEVYVHSETQSTPFAHP